MSSITLTPTDMCILHTSADLQAPKTLIRFPIAADARGGIATAATFSFTSSVTYLTHVASVYEIIGAWTEATAVATLNALALGTALDSITLLTAAISYNADVLGDDAYGVKRAFASGEEDITLALRISGMGTPDTRTADRAGVGGPGQQNVHLIANAEIAVTYTMPEAGNANWPSFSIVGGI